MSDTDKISALRQVFCQVLEEQMFLFADDAKMEDITFPEEPMVRLAITYSGFASGGMHIVLPSSLCREITASVLGIEEEEITESTDVVDAAKELINMTCGQFLTTFYGSEPVMNLCVPEARQLNEDEFAALRKDFAGLSFLVDDHPVLLEME